MSFLFLKAFVSANLSFKEGPECIACEYAVTFLEVSIISVLILSCIFWKFFIIIKIVSETNY